MGGSGGEFDQASLGLIVLGDAGLWEWCPRKYQPRVWKRKRGCGTLVVGVYLRRCVHRQAVDCLQDSTSWYQYPWNIRAS